MLFNSAADGSLPSASNIVEPKRPHCFSGNGGSFFAVLQRSIALATESAPTLVKSAEELQDAAASVSDVSGLQSSSTSLSRYSKAPGLTSSGCLQVSPGVSQQSP